jgi:hypothetical protein
MESFRSTNLMNQTSPQIVEPNSSVAYSYRPNRGPYLGSHCKLDPYRMTRHAIGGVCDPFSLLPPFDFLLSRPRWRSASLLFLHRLVTSSPTSGAPPLRPHPPPIGRPWLRWHPRRPLTSSILPSSTTALVTQTLTLT